MKTSRFACTFLLSLTIPAIAQNIATTPNISDPELTRPSIMLSGKVVLDDGTPVPGSAAVQTVCKGQKRTVAQSDSHGGFSFTLVEQSSGAQTMSTGFTDASVSGTEGLPVGNTANALHNRREWRECSVQADLPGFTSERVDIIERTDSRGGDIGSIVLHRLANVQGLTISATSAAAPENARRAFEKGFEQGKKNKWDAARSSLQKAVDLYPRYAVAWFELGRAQLESKDPAGARHSFQQSIVADPHYVNPYLGLAQLAGQEQKWQEMADLTAKVVALNPINFPNAWFYNGYANYSLGKVAEAGKSAEEGLKIDAEHHYPKLEYLLGMVCLEEQNYPAARQHMEVYRRLSTDPREIAEAQKQLTEITRLAGPLPEAAAGKN